MLDFFYFFVYTFSVSKKNISESKPQPTVVIVEDEAIVALDLRMTLSRLGYKVLDVVNNGSDAVMKVLSLKPDVVIMDIILQGVMDGIEAAWYIRGQSSVPIIFSTANADEATLVRTKGIEDAFVVLKPVDRYLLMKTLNTIFSDSGAV